MGFPKPQRRLVDRTAARREAARAWQDCCRLIDARDGYRCRICTRRVRKTMELVPDRAEHHHLTPRSIAPSLRCDVRNVLSCCLECHGKITRHEIDVSYADQVFEVNGVRYPSADGVLRFENVRGA